MINNPNIFIGQAVQGSTNGAPLSVGSTGLLAQGLTNAEATATANATTTSGTDVVMTTMTLTATLAGTYLVMFSGWFTHGTGNATVTISIYVNAVQKTDSVRTFLPFTGAVGGSNGGYSSAVQGIVSLGAGQAADIRWQTSAGTATARQRTLSLVRLA